MRNKNKKILGLSIIEALVATVIVGIGFVAVLQMVSFSVQSIDTSGERTKANFLVNMIAEDVIGHRDSLDTSGRGYAEQLTDSGWDGSTGKCGVKTATTTTATDAAGTTITNVYDSVSLTEGEKAPSAKNKKWNSIFGNNRFVKCKNERDVKTVKIYKICKWTGIGGCLYNNDIVTDEGMYIGRIQINLNGGKKRKYLYFQADYKIKSFDVFEPEPEPEDDDADAGDDSGS